MPQITVHTSLYNDGTPVETLTTLKARLKRKYEDKYTLVQGAYTLSVVLLDWNEGDSAFFEELYDAKLINYWRSVGI